MSGHVYVLLGLFVFTGIDFARDYTFDQAERARLEYGCERRLTLRNQYLPD